MIPVNIQVPQTDALVHRLTQTWTVRQVAVGPGAIHRVVHHAGATRDLVRPTMIVIPVLTVVRSLDLAEDHAHHPGPVHAMVILAIIAQTNYAPNPVDALVNHQVLARVQIPATMGLETTYTPLARNPEVHLPVLTTDVHVATAGARAVADEMTLMK